MPATAVPTTIEGAVVFEPEVHRDDRGVFVESFRQSWLPGVPPMVQVNRADRRAGAVVGLHFHRRQADYWYVVDGVLRVMLHDLRVGSPTDGTTWSIDLGTGAKGADHRGIYIPPGVAHGFAALSDVTITYLVDQYYDPADELGIAWNDPDVGADWGIADPVLSERDRGNPRRSALGEAERPLFGAAPQ